MSITDDGISKLKPKDVKVLTYKGTDYSVSITEDDVSKSKHKDVKVLTASIKQLNSDSFFCRQLLDLSHLGLPTLEATNLS